MQLTCRLALPATSPLFDVNLARPTCDFRVASEGDLSQGGHACSVFGHAAGRKRRLDRDSTWCVTRIFCRVFGAPEAVLAGRAALARAGGQERRRPPVACGESEDEHTRVRQAKVSRPPSTNGDDETDDLPPIDGDETEEAAAEDEELDEEPLDGGDPMDDSTGEGDPLEEIEVAGSESGWLDDAGESDGLDVGTPDTFGDEEEGATLLEGAEELDASEDELSFGGPGTEADSIVGDAGEEGFEDEDEDLREEDLPRMDSGQDDTDDSADLELMDALSDEEVSEEARPPWDDRAWERMDGVAPTAPVDVVAWSDEGLVVAGRLGQDGQATRALARLDRAGRQLTLLEAAGLRGVLRSIAIDARGGIFVSTPRAGVLVSDDGGESFRDLNGWRDLFDRSEAEKPLDLVAVGTDLWGRASGGALVWSGDRGKTWSRALPDYRFETIAGDEARGELVAVAREAVATTIARGAGGKLLISSAGPLPGGKTFSLVADRGQLAVGLARGAFRAEDRVWVRLEGTAGLTAMTFARGDGTLLFALHSEAEGRAWILEARAGAVPLTVAEIGDAASLVSSGGSLSGAETSVDGDEAWVRALCWDPTVGAVWAAGGFGLIGLRPARH